MISLDSGDQNRDLVNPTSDLLCILVLMFKNCGCNTAVMIFLVPSFVHIEVFYFLTFYFNTLII